MNNSILKKRKWQFWIDRGGTFTDIVALTPENEIITHKLLSENPEHYQSAPIEGIRQILQIPHEQPLPIDNIEVIKMGTTVATNALLEKKGEPVILVINQGFKDALRIGYQNRPDIFARHIILPEMLYQDAIAVQGRFSSTGEELQPLNLPQVEQDLQQAYDQGFRSCAIVLLHSYRYPDHELQIGAIASKIGYTQISLSHQTSNLMKLVSRGDTTVVDAYLSPVLRRYIQQIYSAYTNNEILSFRANAKESQPSLMFMQSNGGLVDSKYFQGKDSILSGPAGGIVGAVKTSQQAGFNKIITFDMGGTSTDVAHYAGEYERNFETEVAGVRICTPMMAIHTVAAGGGSICHFDGERYRVGPESAGANPGPVCYGKGDKLTITDCNLLLGKIQGDFFPKVFGKNANEPLNLSLVEKQFQQLKATIKTEIKLEEIAQGFLTIAVEIMANAIKKISLQKGYDVSEYALCCFGGAGGQHACLIAENLGMKTIIIHPFAGVLSAYGIGLAEIIIIKEKSLNLNFNLDVIEDIKKEYKLLEIKAYKDLEKQINRENSHYQTNLKIYLKYQGTDFSLPINFNENYIIIIEEFNQIHKQRYGFILPEKQLIIEKISLELISPTYRENHQPLTNKINSHAQPITTVKMYSKNQWYDTPVYERNNLSVNQKIIGPALIIESTGTNVIEKGWQGKINNNGHLILTYLENQSDSNINHQDIAKPDPILLEIFNNLFRFIAEEMGITLQNTSYSVNIKERLDFSCAIFDSQGELVANAPHIPVHLGSMSESVKALINDEKITIEKGDVYLTNNPYNGGTHLPDITAITPVFINDNAKPNFYVASRGHHADIGGITPASMPSYSTNIEEEGILIDNFCLIKNGQLQEQELQDLLTNHAYPVRYYQQNLADLKAQVAANKKGVKELINLVNKYGLETVNNYMQFVQDNAEKCVKKAIKNLSNGSYAINLDNGAKIQTKITINQENLTANIDFTGTSAQQNNNFNAPVSITKAVVLYVFRTLVDDDIPLNAGCLKPLNIIIPEGCLLNPKYPCAVVAGNVETSQNIADCLYGALGIMANSQGTMNNFTFGNRKYQYYETICGGSGAVCDHDGTDAIQVHMTNSRLTDVEVLETRYPVRVEEFKIRENSGGEGKYRGGNGVIRAIRFLQPMSAGILSSRRVVSSQGLEGGKEGKKGVNYIIKNNNEKQLLLSNDSVFLDINDVFVIETPGGGGFGLVN
ncbi:hydantoinase B/oxoprolinase family protein [Cyanobacterium sp. DS4]|uniref:hydantoinase B/oxoprolinase family protein n=1 Tax=Cyanobacterium sp. DS4 TaxID=2878255 RepID=UPI002E8137DA|nr:hydantoinase B/oxoprolinase family protein [Cyanobacterium sp. Dongsha4]WVL00956.1 hydantoinase B/oxoprolinase family protein [Cyanobacterium sp. Dongsha4]